MDDMAFGYDRPQEDELALVALGAPSPIWEMGFPGMRRGQSFLTLQGVSAAQRERWIETFMHLLRLLTYRHGGKPLLLKSPPHTARLALLARLLPQARFVHIVREPQAVFASSVHLWRQMQTANTLIGTDAADVESWVLQTFTEMYAGFDAARAGLRPGQFHQLRYEDLVARPLETLEECYRVLELGEFATVQSRIADYLASVREYRTNSYELAAEARLAVREAWGGICREWGYEC
jgi:hypothetical protein